MYDGELNCLDKSIGVNVQSVFYPKAEHRMSACDSESIKG